MKSSSRHDKALLLKTARAVFKELEHRAEGTTLRLRWPRRVWKVNTGGWRAFLGTLGKGRPRLQIWFDRFAGYEQRKFNFCFYLDSRAKMRRLAQQAAKQLPIERRVTHNDMEDGDEYFFLSDRLKRNEFNAAILEEYWGKYSYFGIYDPTPQLARGHVNSRVCARAAAFYLSVARAMPNAQPESEEHEVYSRNENRKLVAAHLRRERSSYLATTRKAQDGYQCQVCNLRFVESYGKLGENFAEAHHRTPLNQLKGNVRTRVEDLVTVCSNCHRMLHRMDGKRGDVEKLRAIFRRRNR